jgi:bifunctional non-homologous end joining protein LigD
MLGGKSAADPDVVWDGSQGFAAPAMALVARVKPTRGKPRPKSSAKLPHFIAPQLCKIVERPPAGEGWAHEIKFDGYHVQLRIAGRDVTLKTHKGLDWTAKFGAIAKTATDLPDAIIDGEIVALDSHALPISPRSKRLSPQVGPKT